MGTREELQTVLETLLGSRHVYFQPPPSVELRYPAIVYKKSPPEVKYGSNSKYVVVPSYTITVIDKEADSDIPRRVSDLQHCSAETSFVVDNLNHDVFKLYF